MKTFLKLALFIFPMISCNRSEYYKIFEGSILIDQIYNQEDFNLKLGKLINDLPSDYSLTPIIFHKYEINDSIINYVTFQKIWWNEKKVDPNLFKIIYRQDSTFMFLNKKLPKFSLKSFNGTMFSSNQLLGKPTLITFWGTGCRGCIEEMPQLNKLKEKYNDSVNFIAITSEPEVLVKNFLKIHSFDFNHLIEAKTYVRDTLSINQNPMNFFIDKNGYIKDIKIMMPLENNNPGKDEKPMLSNREFDSVLRKLLKL
jgi:cytochrome c biogenesis protein CcmG, thiol:disulfide interchange protein DsbE